MINRFFRPSSPRYTSQFVEEQYPIDLIMQSGAVKYAQQQDFMNKIGQMQSGIAELATPGARTEEIAPIVIQNWEKNLQSYMNTFSDNWDSPQALQELGNMRMAWLQDPNVQLIKRDRIEGNAELNELKKSKTYTLDYDPNRDPKTSRLKQFRLNSQYQSYSPLVNYVDVAEKIRGRLKDIPVDEFGMADRAGMQLNPATGEYEWVYKDQSGSSNVMKVGQELNNILSEAMSGSSDWSRYWQTQFRDENGELRPPTEKEAIDYFTRLAEPMKKTKSDIKYTYSDVFEEDSITPDITSKINFGSQGFPMPTGEVGEAANETVSRKKFRMARKNPAFSDTEKNVVAQLKSIYKELDTTNPTAVKNAFNKLASQEHSLDLNLVDIKDPKLTEQYLTKWTSGSIKDNKVTAPIPSSRFAGTQIYDLDKGENIDRNANESRKKLIDELFVKDGAMKFEGFVNDMSIAQSPFPGAAYWSSVKGENSDTRHILVQDTELADRQRKYWNWGSVARSPYGGMGELFAANIVRGNKEGQFQVNYRDTSMTGMGDPKSLKAEDGSYYILPVFDYSKNKMVYKMYADNPFNYPKNEGLSKDQQVYGLSDNTNKAFIYEIEGNNVVEDGSKPVIDALERYLNQNKEGFDQLVFNKLSEIKK